MTPLLLITLHHQIMKLGGREAFGINQLLHVPRVQNDAAEASVPQVTSNFLTPCGGLNSSFGEISSCASYPEVQLKALFRSKACQPRC